MDEKVERALLDEADALTSVEQRRADATDRLFADQQRIDAKREKMADELIANQHVTSLDEALRFARSWIITAAQYAANADYYRDERDKLRRVLSLANDQLFESCVDDVEHQITSHADTLPEAFRRLAAGHAAAFETLQAVVREWVEAMEAPTLRDDMMCDSCGQYVAERPDRSGIAAHRCPHGVECILEPGDPRIGKSDWGCKVCGELASDRVNARWRDRNSGRSIDARLDVVERRILAQGATAKEWAVEVTQPVQGVWTATFYLGVRSFQLAESDDATAEQHCMFIGTQFVKALAEFIAVSA